VDADYSELQKFVPRHHGFIPTPAWIFQFPEGVGVAHAEAKYANGMLEVRVPAPQVTTRRMIEVKAA
jgi:hypothetical protein